MLAVVLVGGFGTRLRPLTNEVPKPMLPIGHRPMIVHLVERLGLAGVSDVVLALGFKPEPFASAFPGDRCGDVRIHYAVEPEPLDTGGAIAFAARRVGVESTFVVANGDIVTDLDVAGLVAAHRSIGTDATIHLTPVADPSEFGVVEADPFGIVRRFVEKPTRGETESDLINAGTYVFEPSVLDRIEEGARVSIERVVFPELVTEGRLGARATLDYWIDTGRPEQYLKANIDLITGARTMRADPLAPTASVAPDAVVSNAVIGDGAVVGSTAEVLGSLVLPEGIVGAGCKVTDSIVAGEIGAGASVSGSVIGAGYQVPAGSVVVDERLPAAAA